MSCCHCEPKPTWKRVVDKVFYALSAIGGTCFLLFWTVYFLYRIKP